MKWRSRYGRASALYLFAARKEEPRYSLLKTKNFSVYAISFSG